MSRHFPHRGQLAGPALGPRPIRQITSIWQPRRSWPSAWQAIEVCAQRGDGTDASSPESGLLGMIATLPDAIFPNSLSEGEAHARGAINALVKELEASSEGGNVLSSPDLIGLWKLRYASTGTVVTRSLLGRLLRLLQQLPFVGLLDVRQMLEPKSKGKSYGCVHTTDE